MITLAEAKEYLRVTYDDDDGYISSLIVVAEEYLVSGITEFKLKMVNPVLQEKGKLLEKVIVQHLYDERYMFGKKLEVNQMITSMMLQLDVMEVPYVQPRSESN